MKKIDNIIKESIDDYVNDLLNSPAYAECDHILADMDNNPAYKKMNRYMYKKYLRPLDVLSKDSRDSKYAQGQEDGI